MTRHLIAILVAVTGATAVATPRPAEACSLPPPVWVNEDLTELTGVPTSGVVPIFVIAQLEDAEVTPPSMTVLDPQESPVAGTIELTEHRLIWRSDAPLAPGTTYAAVLEVAYETFEFTFTTRSDDSTPELALTPGEITLEEIWQTTSEICCDAGINTCGIEEYEHCWRQSARALPNLTVVFDLDLEAARYYDFDYQAPGAASASSGVGNNGGGWLWARYDERHDEYCVTVTATSFAGGAPLERTVCQQDSALVTLPPFEPEEPDYAQCDEPPVDPDTGEEIDTGTGGCSSGGTGAAWWLLLALAVALRYSRTWASKNSTATVPQSKAAASSQAKLVI